MSTLHTILTVARFERKTLLRSWFFRIFAGLFIIGLGIFNVVTFIDASGVPWIFRALPASIPYTNLIILNLGQAIVAVFLASEFLKQDRKNDTVEVIYARSMSNLEYIIGKTIGILAVFIILNFIILFMAMGFSFFSGDSAKGIAEFFLYPLIISIPTLTFILGLSFFLMTVLRNQAVTFILLLGYIALTVFYLNDKYYHLFDYIAYKVPMLNSTIGGFANITELLLHRGLYFLLGIGMVFFTVFKLQRLPQSNKFKYLPLFAAIAFIAAGVFVGYSYVKMKKVVIEQKKQMIALNGKYAFEPKVYVSMCDIDLKHTRKMIDVTTNLKVVNKGNKNIEKLIFSLNPSLNIRVVEINGKPVNHSRELHLVIIDDIKSISPGDSLSVLFSYQGKINENTHMLDVNPEEYVDYLSLDIFKARKRFAYITRDFVCLTSESLWYPTAGVTYSKDRPGYHQPDFTEFTLRVTTSPKLLAVSQGKSQTTEDGTYQFINDYPLPKISLLIGDYVKYTLDVDSVEYSIYTIKGNDYYIEQFPDFRDTLPAIIQELRNEYETLIDLEFGFRRFAFAEVPVNLSPETHIWSAASDAVQPEMIFYPEKGVIMEETDFRKRKNRFEKRMKSNNEDVTPEELQCRIFKRFVRRNLMAPPNEWYSFGDVVNKYTYSLIPHFYTFVTQMECERWPILNLATEAYLRERYVNNVSSWRWFHRGLTQGEKINLELNQSSLSELLSKDISKIDDEEDSDNPLAIKSIVLAKGDYLFSLLRARYGDKEFNALLNEIISNNMHRSFRFSELEQGIEKAFGNTITQEIDSWYTKIQLPGFMIENMQNYKVQDGEATKYQIRFKVANPEPVDGIITITIETDEKLGSRGFGDDQQQQQPSFTKRVLVPGQSAKEVGIVFQEEPKRMNIFTNISQNLPNTLTYEFSAFDETKRTSPLDGDIVIPLFELNSTPNEFIVDNEDPGFSFVHQSNVSYLKSLITKDTERKYKYSGIQFWSPPNQWTPVLRSGFYGRYIRSAMYTATGDGARKVEWKADLPQGAYYDVYCHTEKVNIQWYREKRKSNYNYLIYHDDGVEDITLSDEELENGWNYLGTFYISPENAKVEMTNKSVGRMIFADAVKWVRK